MQSDAGDARQWLPAPWRLAGLGLVILFALVRAADAQTNPHSGDRQDTCPACHFVVGERVVIDRTLAPADPISTCTACHPQVPGRDHPAGVPVRTLVPTNLPLGGGGKLVCSTCHDPHNETKYPGLLRMEFNALCAACHK